MRDRAPPELDLNRNPLECLPKEIGGLTSLQVLDLRGTKLKDIPDELAAAKRVRSIRADETLPATAQKKLKKLLPTAKLKLEQNELAGESD